MNTLYIAPSVLGFEKHIVVADALAIVQQQLETTKHMGVVNHQLRIIKDILLKNFDENSKVLKTFKRWNKKSTSKIYLSFKIALADDFAAVSEEDYLIYGDIYYSLEDRYLNEKDFKASKDFLSGYD